MLKLNDVTKIYQTASKEKVTALSNVSLFLDKNGLVFIVGQSGSGKTTLLNLIGGLDMPEQGEILVDEHVLDKDISLEKYRQNYVGFVFQEYNLLENLSVYENIAIAVSGCTKKELNEKIVKVLKEVDLSGYENRKMNELSGGQKQRVAIARALAKNTSVLLCDEPTGNLDSHTSKEIFDLLKKISLEKTVIVVSHNEELAKEYADRLIRIADGKIVSDQQYLTERRVNGSGSKTVNNVPFRYKLKLGLKNLFTQKFKTSIAASLLLLSLVTVCIMQICLSYNSERNLAKSLSGEKTVVVLQNNSKSGISNLSERYQIKADLSKYFSEDRFYDGYRTIYGTVFISNNAEINKDFYVKQALGNNEAYISDYFVDIVIKLNDDYGDLIYVNYEDLLGQEVVYQNMAIFKIAGILKTDYKEYMDERGNQKENKITTFEDKKNYISTYEYKLNYEYILVNPDGHELDDLVAEIPATCKDTGVKEHRVCRLCGKNCDPITRKEIADLTIPTTNDHTFGGWTDEVAPTTTEFGTKGHKDCTVCGRHFDKDGGEITELRIAKIGTHNVVINGESKFYEHGESVTVTAEDKEGKVFKGWQDASGKIVSTQKEYTFEVKDEMVLTAVYEDKSSGGGEITPPAKKDGLSGGAIAGIVTGSAAVAGLGGFAVLWFAVKKKTFADLGVAIKALFTKKK